MRAGRSVEDGLVAPSAVDVIADRDEEELDVAESIVPELVDALAKPWLGRSDEDQRERFGPRGVGLQAMGIDIAEP